MQWGNGQLTLLPMGSWVNTPRKVPTPPIALPRSRTPIPLLSPRCQVLCSPQAAAVADGQAALDQKLYDDAAADFAAVGATLAPVYDRFVADLASLETASGYRLIGDASSNPAVATESAVIEKWVDGDTVETSLGRIRLIGIDVPEMDDVCSEAQDSLRLVEILAPAGTTVTLVNPESVADADTEGNELRYLDLADNTDIGYTLLLNDLARARYDSQDGNSWHPREQAYRATNARPDQSSACSWAIGATLLLASDSENEDEHHRSERLDGVAASLATSALLANQVSDARVQHEAEAAAAEAAAAAKAAEQKKAATKKKSTKKKSSSGGSSAEPWNQPGPDLDCIDIKKMVRITGPDYHNLDRDGDGWGCESYGSIGRPGDRT